MVKLCFPDSCAKGSNKETKDALPAIGRFGWRVDFPSIGQFPRCGSNKLSPRGLVLLSSTLSGVRLASSMGRE